MRFGFVGGSDQSQSPLANTELSVNFFPEANESQNARTAWMQVYTAGLSLLGTPPGALPSERGFCTVSGRTFSVAGTHLLEWTTSGITDYGGNPGTANNNILDDGLPATMIGGGTAGGIYPGQLLIASGGTLTVFLLATNLFSAIAGAPANVLMIDYVDGFFVALQSVNDFQISAPLDATNWPGLSISQVSVFSDQLLSIIASNRLLWIFGAKRAVVYYNAGLPIFPFQVVSGGFLEVGIIAQFSAARITTAAGTTIAWLGGDERGAGVIYVANGFIPQRYSTRAFEYFLSKNTIQDAVGFATQEQGHNFYWLWFPTANATWRLDVDNGKLHQLSSLVKGQPAAHLARCHTYNAALGGHLVGDRTSGNVYLMDAKFLSENIGVGIFNPIIRTRVGPTVGDEGGRIPTPINEFQVDVETGLGPQPPLLDAFGLPRDPLMMMSYSEDYGKTYGPQRMIACGQAGQFQVAAIDRRLGSWLRWTPKVTVSDPIPWRIVDAYTNGTQQPAPRLAKSFAKIT
jgi:hypothetical protein